MIDKLIDLGASAAVVITVWFFISYIRGRDKSKDEMVTNHIEHNTQVMEQVKTTLDLLLGFLRKNGR